MAWNTYSLLKLLLTSLTINMIISTNLDKTAFPEIKPEDWPHKPIFVQAGCDMTVFGIGSKQPLPIGVPFDVESSLFKGKILLRFRHADSDDPGSHSEYFRGRKRLMQIVTQGQFKRRIKMSDVYVGGIFQKALAVAPPPFMAKIINAVLRRVAPGVIMDLSSDAPRVIALLAGTVQTMSIDRPGHEPDITLPEIEENVASTLGKNVSTKSKRRKVLANPKKAASYEYDTSSIYTFETYDDVMDFGRGTMKLPAYGEFDIKPMIGPQPFSWTAVTESGEMLYDLQIWHESHIE